MQGARRFPVGPSIASTTSEDARPAGSNVWSLRPLATITLDARRTRACASFRPSFREAETCSAISISPASRNLDALTQEVQPFRW